ncbi:MAG: NAD(P)H-dependent oxidoreductase subunit E [Oligoflexia bacterium]|nr:NAD(P)H-dependent oxidoreductase subunit E [Oligoflexia bacterium]
MVMKKALSKPSKASKKPVKKVAVKKVAVKKVLTKKIAPKKAIAKKVATKKIVTKKIAVKKTAAKKVSTKKVVIKKKETPIKKQCQCKSHYQQVDKNLILQWIKKIGIDSSAAVPILQEIQTHYGYLPREAMDIVVENTNISASQLFGVATFYAQFRLKPIGRNLIRVCHGTACHVSGADRLNTSIRNSLGIMDEKEDTTADAAYTIENVACLGCCSLAPVMTIGGEVFGNLSGADAQKALKKHAEANGEKLKLE